MGRQLIQLIRENRALFWSVDETQLRDLNEQSIVETILNYGDLESVKKLFTVLGIERVANIFYQQQSHNRSNYYPQVTNFFDAYFKRHVQKYSNPRAN